MESPLVGAIGLFLSLMGLVYVAVSLLALLKLRRLPELDPNICGGRLDPLVDVFMPCDGHHAEQLESTLRALLGHGGSGVRVFLCLREPLRGLRRMVDKLDPGGERCRVVVAGDATACCQKNHNLLAGLAAAGGRGEVYVFCDADAAATRPGWVRTMACAALSAGPTVGAATTFRTVAWGEGLTLADVYYHCYVSFQLMGMMLTPAYVWGGATAMRRDRFDELEVARHWERSVVDDITLAALLQRHGLSARFVPNARVPERQDRPRTVRAVFEWTIRQAQYVRCCMPVHFVGALLFGFPALFGWLLLAAAAAPGLPLPAPELLAGGGVAALGWTLGACLRGRAAGSHRELPLVLANPLLTALAVTSITVAWIRPHIRWGEAVYRPGPQGTVHNITWPDRSALELPAADPPTAIVGEDPPHGT